jgi:hypothetical protein
VFGDDYAAKDKGVLSAKGKTLRTFEYNGEKFFMESHLRDGVKDSAAECLRIHFAWSAKERLIIVGHCGGHLDF